MDISIRSTLAQRVESRTSLDGEATLMLTLTPKGVGWPVEARIKLGKDPEHFLAADRIADMCQRGDEVTVKAAGLMGRTDHSTLAILLRDVQEVEIRGAYGCFVVPKPVRNNEGKLL